jgi:hypothetical protein
MGPAGVVAGAVVGGAEFDQGGFDSAESVEFTAGHAGVVAAFLREVLFGEVESGGVALDLVAEVAGGGGLFERDTGRVETVE